MALPSKSDELATAWRALSRQECSDGWRTIRIAASLPCHVLAARYYPEGGEALLFGFQSSSLEPGERLPCGHGFAVEEIRSSASLPGLVWYALSRQSAGDPALFAVLARDLLDSLGACPDEAVALLTLVERLRDWQRFMKRTQGGELSREEEIGLFGELVFLEILLRSGFSPRQVLLGWLGPEGAAQDFDLGAGAVEVKTVVSKAGFPARISSLEQLDDETCPSLFVAAVRLVSDPAGEALPERVSRLRGLLGSDTSIARFFEKRLADAGYLEAMSGTFSNRFGVVETRYFPVAGSFPRLTRTGLSPCILDASYVVDLDGMHLEPVPLATMLTKLEVS